MIRLASLAVVLAAVAVAGCGGSSSSGERALEVFGPYRGVEADRFAEVVEPFTRRTGIPVRYVGSVDFVSDLQRRAGEDNDPPDLAVVPQPGLIRELVRDGSVARPSAAVASALAANYPPEAVVLGRVDGEVYAVPFRLTVKSLVWYRPSVFAAHGWKPPRTLAELDRLAARIADAGEMAPWCLGISAGSATGWPATDWVEDVLLRTAGPRVYAGWASGTVPFDDARVASAFADVHDLVLAPGRAAGGIASVVATSVSSAVEPLFADPPGCAMLKQGDFATAWMPDGTTIGPDGDVDWFLLPGTAAGTTPVLVGGDSVIQFRRSPEADALMRYLAGPEAGRSWVAHGGFVSPKKTIPPDAYPSDYLRELTSALGRASTLAFDASDRMPPAIGSGLLWREITRWVAGVEDYETLARRLDAARALSAQAGD